jgi:hypothetical protein
MHAQRIHAMGGLLASATCVGVFMTAQPPEHVGALWWQMQSHPLKQLMQNCQEAQVPPNPKWFTYQRQQLQAGFTSHTSSVGGGGHDPHPRHMTAPLRRAEHSGPPIRVTSCWAPVPARIAVWY